MVRFIAVLFKRKTLRTGKPPRPPGRLARFARDVRGVAALEFAFIAPPFFMLLFSMFEIGMTYTADAVLQNAVTDTARMIRTGQVQSQNMQPEDFRAEVCERISIFLECDETHLAIDVRKFTAFSGAGFTNPLDGGGNFRDDLKYEPGTPCDVILVRAFYAWEPVTPFLGEAMKNMGNDGQGKSTARLLQGTAAIRNEPYLVGGPVC